MKIVLFDDERNILDIIPNVLNPQIYSNTEISWETGGLSGISSNYVILEDNVNFELVTDEQIFEQIREQELISLAREYDERRIEALAFGTDQDEKDVFDQTRQIMMNARNRQEILLARNDYRGRSPRNPRQNPNQPTIPNYGEG